MYYNKTLHGKTQRENHSLHTLCKRLSLCTHLRSSNFFSLNRFDILPLPIRLEVDAFIT